MNLDFIARRTGVPLRRLRYAAEHGLVDRRPGKRRHLHPGRGAARRFTHEEAVLVALAGTLVDAGMRRGAALLLARVLCRPIGVGEGPGGDLLVVAAKAAAAGRDVFLDLADRSNVRLRGVSDRDAGPYRAGVWRQARTGAELASTYRPLLIVTLDLTSLLTQLAVTASAERVPSGH